MTFEEVDWTVEDVDVKSGVFTPDEVSTGVFEVVAFPSALARRLWNTSAFIASTSGSGDSEIVDGIAVTSAGMVPSGNVRAWEDT